MTYYSINHTSLNLYASSKMASKYTKAKISRYTRKNEFFHQRQKRWGDTDLTNASKNLELMDTLCSTDFKMHV